MKKGITPRPFLKWAGGKTRLLPELLALVDRVPEPRKARYHEPFLGGGALFFELAHTGRLGRKQAMLSDLNAALINAYRAVMHVPDALVIALRDYEWMRPQMDSAKWYAMLRENLNEYLLGGAKESSINAAAHVIALNKTCYNGLWRVNSKGEFNVPCGHYKNPTICDARNLFACSKALRNTELSCQSFLTEVSKVKCGDLVYFDPPYHGTFTGYNGGGFGENMQWALASTARYLHNLGACVIVSNADTPLIRELYSDFSIAVVNGHRSIQANGSGRGKTPELLIHNLPEAS